MTFDLKPCPFCGDPGQIKDISTPFRHGWIGCPVCHVFINWNHSHKDAAARWNRRAGK